MVRKARVWFDGDLAWNPAEMEEDEGGVAIQTQTAVLESLNAGENLPLEPEEQETESPPPAVSRRNADKPRRHLAGANWLSDWTRYLPTSPQSQTPQPKKPPAKSSDT